MNIPLQARHHMIDGQLGPMQVLDDRLIAAIGITPREDFVPDAYAHNAYIDAAIPLPNGRYAMPPMLAGRLLEAADLEPQANALVIGANLGYIPAILHHLGYRVTALEEQSELANEARNRLNKAGLKDIQVQTSGLHLGHKSAAPYQLIIVDGAVECIPSAWTDQLSDGGGQLLLVHNHYQRPGHRGGLGQAMRIEQRDGQLHYHTLFDTSLPVIPSFTAKETFTF